MRKCWKRYGLLLWLLCITGLPLCAQSYDKQWEQVDQARKKGLPQTVIRLADNIYRKAEKEGNVAQLLKAYLCREKARQEVTPDSLYTHLAYMEQWVRRTANPVEKALLHTLLAGEYRDYLQNNRRALQARAQIEEAAWDDIRTWSAGLFIRLIDDHIQASLQDAEQLSQARAQAYVPLVEIEEGSLYYRHDLYHLVARRAIDLYQSIEGYAATLPIGARIDSLYLAMLATYRAQAKAEEAQAGTDKAQTKADKTQTKADKAQTKADKAQSKAGSSQTGIDAALLLTRLHYADYKQQTGNIIPLQNGYIIESQESHATVNLSKDDIYLAQLDTLIARYGYLDLSAEAYLRKATCLHGQGRTAEALRLCGEAVARYAAYPRIQALENLRREMSRPTLSVRMEGTAYPGDSLGLRVQYRLLNGFSITCYATDLTETPQQERAPTSDFLRRHARKLSTLHYALAPLPQADVAEEDLPYQRADTTFHLPVPDAPGTYLLRITPDEGHADSVDHLLAVTRLKVLTLSLSDNQMEVVAVDARSGQPVEGATVGFHTHVDKEKRKTLLQVTTDNEGKARFIWIKGIRCYTAVKGTDTALPPGYISLQTAGLQGATAQRRLTLLTDRALYRPGQTIHVKGVAYVEAEDTVHVLAGESYELQLLDANRKEVAKQTLATNEFGSFSADFTLPAACLNGTFLLRAGTSGSTTVRVEEYKRPTFEICFNPMAQAYCLGDTVRLAGTVTAYNGAPLQTLPLAYSVSRTAGVLWQGSPAPLRQDTVQLDTDGSFSLPVVLTPPAQYNPASGRSVNYRVTATVTEAAGETESAGYTLTASPKAFRFSNDLPASCCKDSLVAATFQVRNADGRLMDVQGTCRLLPVDAEAPVYEAPFTSGKRQTFPEWSRLPSGKYRLELSVAGPHGEERGSDTDKPAEIYLFSLNDTRLAAPMTRFTYGKALAFDAAHPAEIYYGTSCTDVYLLVDLFNKEKRLESYTVQLGDTLARMVFPYKEEYGEGVSALFTFVKAGEVNSYRVELRKRQPDRALRLKWTTFRDRLRPGQSEEWKLTVQTPQGRPADAELLALLYDASLDRLYKRNQSLHAQPLFYLPYRTRGYSRTSSLVFYPSFPVKRENVSEWLFDHLYEVPVYTARHLWGNVRLAAAGASLTKSAGLVVEDQADVETASALASDAELNDMGGVETSAEEASTDLLRTDFSETAFFYPQLRADAQGEVTLTFTLPQSLTRWNFRSYAHTREMLTGSLDTTVVAAKEFMLTPDMPRFVRVGDRTVIAAAVDNLAERDVAGTATLTLFNPATAQTLATLDTCFSVKAGRRATVSFPFTVTDSCSVIGVRIIADGGTYSDGEQRLLAVLDNRAFITETMPLPVRGKQTRTFSLDSLFNHHSPAATHRRLTLEFTANPAWYALLALPSLSRPVTDNALTLAAAYYADCLAGYIAASYPPIKTMVAAWQADSRAQAALVSPLARNQALKELLLDETPWAAAADNESERMASFARLFDTNDLGNRLLSTLTRLQALQAADGSWSWYKGMAGSRSITTRVTCWLLRLPALTGTPLTGDALAMQRKAMDYLHRQALNDYLEMKKRADKKGNAGITDAATDYLYLVAMSGQVVPKANEEAYRYWLSLLPKCLASGSVTGKAHAAYILYRAGQVSEADAFIASLMEYMVQEEELGTHFAFQDQPYVSSDLVLAAHVATMEALHTVGGHEDLLEGMKGWLLKQKQAGAWNSAVATADAVYALLCRGQNPLEEQGAVSISLDNHTVATLPADASLPGAGYVKKQYEEGSAEVNARALTLQKEDGGTAWGALYAQYLTPMRDVNGKGTALGIDRRLYVERLAADGQSTLQPVTSSTPLALGDKVISRLVLRVDRAMDFVQLKARHAACFEPVNTLSGYRQGSGLSYYMEVDDASTNCYFDHLGKGTYAIELPFRIARAGVYEAGTATLQCAYAPEFAAHSDSEILTVE